MKPFFISYLVGLLSLAVIDGVWLSVIAKPFYTRSLEHLLAPSPRWIPVLLFYLCYAAGISLLVVLPQMRASSPLGTVFVYGALLGFIAYAAYDLTNLATLRDWPLKMTLVDLLWGTLLTGGVSALASGAVKRFGG